MISSSVLAFLTVWGAVLWGAIAAVKRYRREHSGKTVIQPGWVYFLSPVNGGELEPPAPIKIGRTSRDPVKERLPEIETMSPMPLELLWSFRTTTIESKVAEARVHSALAQFRMHGEWFEREPTLMYIDYLKGKA